MHSNYVFKQTTLLLGLITFVLLVNLSAIHFDMMYIEQPLIYSVNQTIHSFSDLLNVYLHPQLLDTTIPFFRPSGHFLLYQLLTPWLGWHNTRAFIIVNLIFLSLSGFFTIKLYARLFPKFRSGGYIAFAIYLMHPALILPRLHVMHFEFAYIFFSLFSCYLFVIFCKKNLSPLYLFIGVLLLYAVAVTFKEPAIMLGPTLASYLCIALYGRPSLLKNKTAITVLFSLTVTTLALAFYLISPWPTLTHPVRDATNQAEMLGSINEFLKFLFGVQHNFVTQAGLFAPDALLRCVVTPAVTRCIVWSLLAMTVLTTILVFGRKTAVDNLEFKKSILFLYTASGLFLILPIAWALGFPWHFSLFLLYFSLVMGFSFEYLSTFFLKKENTQAIVGIACAALIGMTTITVNNANINTISQSQEGFDFKLDRNAIYHAPTLKNLNADSIVIVEDSLPLGDYSLGDSHYRLPPSNQEFGYYGADPKMDKLLAAQQTAIATSKPYLFTHLQPVYNGTLFRWAYFVPTLHEEVYPFQINHMQTVPDAVISEWIRHSDNIFCLGYDKNARWYDRSEDFKNNLLQEKNRRHLVVNQYQSLSTSLLNAKAKYSQILPYADPGLCQLHCDAVTQCKGFTYINNHSISKCRFYDKIMASKNKECEGCVSYIKNTANFITHQTNIAI